MISERGYSSCVQRARVLVAEDDDLLADMVTAILAADERIDVVGRVADATEAVEQTLSLSPDVVLMDIHMPGLDGITAAEILRERGSNARVVILTGSDMPRDEERARSAGAAGYVSKEGAGRELVEATLRAAGRASSEEGV